MSKSCHTTEDHTKGPSNKKFDWIMNGSLLVIVGSFLLSIVGPNIHGLHTFVHTQFELLIEMSWGVALGLFSVGIMNKIPREYFTTIMGRGDKPIDIIKAACAGVVLDMCNHGTSPAPAGWTG